MFIWSDKFETNIELVDSQHKNLVEILNLLFDRINKGNAGEELLDETLEQLMQYADKHFTDEELMMSETKIDERHKSIHRMEHKSFIYDVERMRTHFSPTESTYELLENLAEFITSWLTYHILGMDKIMAAQLNAINNGLSPEQAFDRHNTSTLDIKTTRLLLDSTMDMWQKCTDRCYKLESKLASLSNEKNSNNR